MQLIIIGAENSAIPPHKTSIREEKTMYTLHYLHCQNLVENLWDLALERGPWRKRPTGRPGPHLKICLNPGMRIEGGEFQKNFRKLTTSQVRITQDRRSQLNNNNNSNHHNNLLRPQGRRQGLPRHRQTRADKTDRFRRMRRILTQIAHHHPPGVEVGAGTEAPLAEAELMKRRTMIPPLSLILVGTAKGASPTNAAKHAGSITEAKERS